MTAFPRALLVLAMVMLAGVSLPQAAADDCVQVNTTTFAEGLRVIATAGRSIALGFRTGEPGDGLGFVVIITPAICSGLGVGGFELSGLDAANVDPSAKANELLSQVPSFLPLP